MLKSSQTCFERIVKNNTIDNNHYEIRSMPEIIDRVGEDKNGIGYAFYSYYSKMHKNDNVKIVNVNDKAITNIDYPLLFEVYLIYKKDNKNVSHIINWLQSQVGQEFIRNYY